MRIKFKLSRSIWCYKEQQQQKQQQLVVVKFKMCVQPRNVRETSRL